MSDEENTMSTAWTSRYAQRTRGIQSSAIRELLKFYATAGGHLVRRWFAGL